MRVNQNIYIYFGIVAASLFCWYGLSTGHFEVYFNRLEPLFISSKFDTFFFQSALSRLTWILIIRKSVPFIWRKKLWHISFFFYFPIKSFPFPVVGDVCSWHLLHYCFIIPDKALSSLITRSKRLSIPI